MNERVLHPSRIVEMMGQLACFQGVPHESLNRMAWTARQVFFRRNESLFSKDGPVKYLHVVVGGQVRTYMPVCGQPEKPLAVAGPGEVVCLASVYQGQAYASSAMAVVDSYVLEIERAKVIEQLRQDPVLADHMLAAVSGRITAMLREMEFCAPRSGLQRVTCYFLQQQPESGVGAYDILLPSSKRDLAARLNLAPETFSRVLQHISREGAIDVQGRLIQVRDADKLRSLNLTAYDSIRPI
jgi:CRP-like cAMP-binding protein